MKDSILRALVMEPEERHVRFKRNLEFAIRLNTVKWAETILSDIKRVEKNVQMTNTATLGLGVNFRVAGTTAGFRPLDLVQVSKAFRNAHNRLILLDWGGTLVESLDTYEAYAVATGHVPRASIPEELADILQVLGSDPRNHIFIVSGKDMYSMQDFLKSVDVIGLAAEHGCYYRFPKGSPLNKDKPQGWHTMISLDDTSWMDAVRRIMDVYTQRTHGTYIQQKGSAIIWQFRDADPDFGIMQSKELEEHLNEIVNTHQSPLEIIRGGGIDDAYIEVRPAGLSKGLFLEHMLSLLKSKGIMVDFVMGVGDDITDENMFKAIRRFESKTSSKSVSCFAVTVGKKYSEAHAFVDDPEAVIEMLSALRKTSLNQRRYHSALDLSNHDKVAALRNVASIATSVFHRSTSESHVNSLAGHQVLFLYSFNILTAIAEKEMYDIVGYFL